MNELRLTSLHRYPVKSLRGEDLQRVALDDRGLVGDRGWMVVDPDGRFLTQRELPRMCLITARLDANGLLLEAPGVPPQRPVANESDQLSVDIWRDRVAAVRCDAASAEWLSAFLDRPCELVFMPPTSQRPVNPAYALPGDRVGFADGYPLLLICEASLADLNARLDRPVPMARFRPNLVVSGCDAFAEDAWRRIRIGATEFRVAKPCERCAIPSIDIETAKPDPGFNRVLASFRRFEGKILFGQNLLHDGRGELQPGMPVEVLE